MDAIRKELMDILACPKCKAPVTQDGDGIRCTGEACGLTYPIRDGIPVMLIDEATAPESSGREPRAS